MIAPVRDRRTFAALRANGVRVRRGPLSAAFLPEPDPDTTRVAFAITKRVGTAVVRNRLRRRLRALLVDLDRQQTGTVPRGALLVSAGPDAVQRSAPELRNDVETLLTALASRLAERGRP